MEKNKKFRNHISIVAEQVFGGLFAVIVLFAVNIFQDADDLTRDDLMAVSDYGIFIFLAVAAVFIIVVINRLLVWARTYISIEENAIVIERNTVNRKKNTIGIANISNVNMEQNLFEMIMGTCKIKIDTNSRSTADDTDVKIVLKKADAQAFKKEIMEKMQGAEETKPEDQEEVTFDIHAQLGDIIRHGIYSINILSVILLVLGIIGSGVAAVRLLTRPDVIGSLLGMAGAAVVAVSIIVSSLWDTLKDFIRYYDFRAGRKGDKIYICYGLLKTVEYTIPVDKIQALVIRQSLVARIFHRYKAEIINIGMGDEEEEKNSFLVLYGTEKQLKEQIGLLLPEFLDTVEQKVDRMPKSAWAAWMVPFLIYLLMVCAAGAVVSGFLGKYTLLIWGCAAGLIVLVLAGMVLSYLSDGTGIGEDFLKVSNGFFGREYVAVPYEKIQYVGWKQNFIARGLGIQKGQIHLLASGSNDVQDVPYFNREAEDKVRNGMLR